MSASDEAAWLVLEPDPSPFRLGDGLCILTVGHHPCCTQVFMNPAKLAGPDWTVHGVYME